MARRKLEDKNIRKLHKNTGGRIRSLQLQYTLSRFFLCQNPRQGLRIRPQSQYHKTPTLDVLGFWKLMLEWRDAFRTFEWISEYPNPEYHLKTINNLIALAK